MEKRKILLVFLFLVVFVSSFSVLSFADSSSNTSDQRVYSPVYYPDSVVFVSSDGVELMNTDVTATFASDDNYSYSTSGYVDLGRSVSQLYASNGSLLVGEAQQVVSVKGKLLNGYGYNYYQTYCSHSYSHISSSVTHIALNLYDIYIPQNMMVQGSVPWLGRWNVNFVDEMNLPLTVNCLVYVEYSYISFEYETPILLHDTLQISLDSSYSSADIMTQIRSNIPSYRWENGLLINNLVLSYYDLTSSFDSFSIFGETKHTNEFIRGSYKALNTWYDQFGYGGENAEIIIYPTIIEQFTKGVEAIWEFNLFGLFTVGNLFSAVLGLSLLTWLLKIFAR